jgi:hypothetical protein
MLAKNLQMAAKGASGVATTLAYQDFDSINSTATTRTFSNMGFGADDVNRHVLVIVHAFYNTANRDFTSVTIGGENASELIATQQGPVVGGVFSYCGIWAAQPSGTSGNVVITASGSVDSWGASTWSLVTANSTPQATGEATDVSGSVSFTDAYKEVSLFASQGVNDINPNWTNATKIYGNDIRSNEWSSAATGNLINTSGTVSVNLVDGAVFATWA